MAISSVNNITNAVSKIFSTNQNQDNSVQGSKSTGFQNFLTDALGKLNNLEQTTQADSVALATGQTDNLHQVMIDTQKAELSLQFATQIRNKAVDAYNEIMRISL